MASGEKTPLIGDSAGSGGGSGQNPSYYFLQRAESTNKGAGDDGGEVVELPPEGANSSEFDSRPVAVRCILLEYVLARALCCSAVSL